MSQLRVIPTDRPFRDSPDAGESSCLCSRCGRLIEETEMPIRFWQPDAHGNPKPDSVEWRYHPACIGLEGTPRVDVEFDWVDDDET